MSFFTMDMASEMIRWARPPLRGYMLPSMVCDRQSRRYSHLLQTTQKSAQVKLHPALCGVQQIPNVAMHISI